MNYRTTPLDIKAITELDRGIDIKPAQTYGERLKRSAWFVIDFWAQQAQKAVYKLEETSERRKVHKDYLKSLGKLSIVERADTDKELSEPDDVFKPQLHIVPGLAETNAEKADTTPAKLVVNEHSMRIAVSGGEASIVGYMQETV